MKAQEASYTVQLVKDSEWGRQGIPTAFHGHSNGGFSMSVAHAVSCAGIDVLETNSMTSKNAQPNYFHYLNTLSGGGQYRNVHDGGILAHDSRPMRYAKSIGLERDALLFYRTIEEAHAV